MNIYEIGYIQNIPPYGECHTTKFVKATNEELAKKAASIILKVPEAEIDVIRKIKIINE